MLKLLQLRNYEFTSIPGGPAPFELHSQAPVQAL